MSSAQGLQQWSQWIQSRIRWQLHIVETRWCVSQCVRKRLLQCSHLDPFSSGGQPVVVRARKDRCLTLPRIASMRCVHIPDMDSECKRTMVCLFSQCTTGVQFRRPVHDRCAVCDPLRLCSKHGQPLSILRTRGTRCILTLPQRTTHQWPNANALVHVSSTTAMPSIACALLVA